MTTTTTRTIGDHEITLTPGRRYIAARRADASGSVEFEVAIYDVTDATVTPCWEVTGLTRKEANALVRAFNAGGMSYTGRAW